ncbi:MAG: hypothetical protein WC964_03445 [Acholeplasmataceae bacterium]
MSLKQRIIAIIALVLVVVGGVFLYLHFTKTPAATHDGEITIIILDRDGTELGTEVIKYNEGDTFVELLERSEFEFVFSTPHPEWGVTVISILGYALGDTEWWSHDHNDEMSLFGVSSQPFEDKDIFTFQIKSWG